MVEILPGGVIRLVQAAMERPQASEGSSAFARRRGFRFLHEILQAEGLGRERREKYF
jgi:hypothetical protein